MDNIFDFIKPLEQILIILNRNGISVGDVKYILPYSEFLQMRNDRIPYYDCLQMLKEKYGLKIGTMRTKFKKFSSRLK